MKGQGDGRGGKGDEWIRRERWGGRGEGKERKRGRGKERTRRSDRK